MDQLILMSMSGLVGLFVGSLLEFVFHFWTYVGEQMSKSKIICRLAHVPYP